jgi:glycosyltransferase involved in cell wall biosynthesis
VLSQDYDMDCVEVMVVDDGSTDDTEERLKKYGSRIRYLRKPNGGQASAFNLGFANAQGEIIALLDADDYWLPGKLRRILEEFERDSKVGMVHHSLQELNTETGELRRGPFDAVSGNLAASPKSIVRFNPTPTSSLAFRRTVLEAILPMPEAITIQADGYIQALAPFLAQVVAIDEALAVYRIHGANLYFLRGAGKDLERRRLRATTMRALVKGLQDWFASHGYDANDAVVRATVRRWTTVWEREEFAVSKPGRIRFFLHILATHRNQLPLMTWRLVLINYFNALGALVVGYESSSRLDERREHLTRWVRTLLGRS